MRFIEPEESNRFFDAPDEFDYPDSWDLPAADPEPEDDLCQLPPEERLQEAKAKAKPAASIPAALTTAAQLLGGQAETDCVPWTAFKKGMVVTHAEYGDGKIVKLTGRGPKCTATVDFFDGSSRAFRLAFAKLTPVDVDG